jgi:hypothetical protein
MTRPFEALLLIESLTSWAYSANVVTIANNNIVNLFIFNDLKLILMKYLSQNAVFEGAKVHK